MAVELSITIVKYRADELFSRCLESITRFCKTINYEIIIVDNSPTPVEIKTPVIYYWTGKNTGFAAGQNWAISRAKGRYILMLNSDTELTSGSVQKLIAYAKRSPKVGIVCPKIIFPGGEIDQPVRGPLTFQAALSSFFGFGSDKFKLNNWRPRKPQVVERVAFTAVLIRRAVIKSVGLLDTNFKMYFEDADYCQRIQQSKWIIVYLPQASIIHSGGGSSVANYYYALKQFVRSFNYYYDKHEASRHNLPVNLLFKIGIGLYWVKGVFAKLIDNQKRISY